MISEAFGDILAVTNIDLLASVVITGKHVDTAFAVSGATFLPCDSTHNCVSVGEKHINPPVIKVSTAKNVIFPSEVLVVPAHL